MKSTIARAILRKGFFLGDYGTYSKSVSGEREALLKKLIFFLTALTHKLGIKFFITSDGKRSRRLPHELEKIT